MFLTSSRSSNHNNNYRMRTVPLSFSHYHKVNLVYKLPQPCHRVSQDKLSSRHHNIRKQCLQFSTRLLRWTKYSLSWPIL